ncbi:MAG: hypothetical protein K2O11_02460 [Oscillospiraceae bacterium]|nr:hypothetical protein [Oscillospiraceae bacterium]
MGEQKNRSRQRVDLTGQQFDSPLYGQSPAEIGRASLTFIDGTCVEILRAKTVRRNNTSGVPGVEWRKSSQRWRASICFKGKRHYLGSYIRFEDAVKARKRGEEDLHDKFLREFDEQNGRSTEKA